MDWTLDGKELLETLSQGSQSQQSGSASKALEDRTRASAASSHVDEAFRRLGQRLSLQAHGDDASSVGSRRALRTLRVSKESAFDDAQLRRRHSNSPSRAPKQHLLRRLTMQASGRFRQWADAPNEPQQHTHSQSAPEPLQLPLPSAVHKHGLLSAVLEGCSESTPSQSVRMGPPMSPSGSISTKESLSHSLSHSMQSYATPCPRGACLTQPAEPVANEGLDNIEGNLIVFENDVIVVPKQSLHSVAEENNNNIKQKVAEFRIQSCLGQGTFAQVFQCLHIQTGKMVAVKIIKNKPAYTRQATVEIDVFRALQEDKVRRDYMVSLDYFFMHNNHLCLVFEKLALNLYEVLKRRQFRGLPLDIVQQIVSQAVTGVKDLTQKNIVHCDLKPENILLISEEVSQAVVNAEETSRDTDKQQEPPTPTTASAADTDSSTSTKTAQNIQQPEQHCSKRRHLSLDPKQHKIKVIDFGSACFEGYTAHTYIQSRFYRSPEVLVGLPYDSGIDMWSLGCVAAELFLGLPILPGCHEHDQLGRIQEMIGPIPDWMLDQGSKATKYYIKFRPNVTPNSETSSPILVGANNRTPSPRTPVNSASPSSAPPLPQWRIKTQQEFIHSLSQNEIRKKGGLSKLEKQPGSRYFKRQKLADILTLHAQSSTQKNKEMLPAFIHFLYSVLDPDPWKRLTAFQVSQHPFVTGRLSEIQKRRTELFVSETKDENQANVLLDSYWQPPWDPAICRRKLLNVQRQRERQQNMRRNPGHRAHQLSSSSIGNDFVHDPRRPRSGAHSGTPMVESPMDSAMYARRTGNSPPSRLFPSPSLQQRRSSDGVGVTPLSTSLSGLPRQGGATDLAFGADIGTNEAAVLHQSVMPLPSGPQSVGLHDDVRRGATMAGDFALALQRPGIVPGSGPNLGSSYYDSSTIGSYSQSYSERNRHAIQTRVPEEPMSHYGRAIHVSAPMSHSQLLTPQSSVPSMMSTTTGSNRISSSVSSNFSVQETAQHGQSHGILYADPLIQQQQQQQRQSLHLQQQATTTLQPQQLWMAQQQAQQGLQQVNQTQFQQFAVKQQQPVYLANDPGGGVYFVATSSTGQPVLLQPVGQPGIYGGNVIQSNVQLPGRPSLVATQPDTGRWVQQSGAPSQQVMYQDSFIIQPPPVNQAMQYSNQGFSANDGMRYSQPMQPMIQPQSLNPSGMHGITQQEPVYAHQQHVLVPPPEPKPRHSQTRRHPARGTSM